MNLKVGIVGLPNAGKSTLFNALLKKQVAFAANYPFATIEPNVGVVPVPDFRLQELASIVEKTEGTRPPLTPAVIEFVDIAGLVAGASQGEGLGNKFLSHIREVELICQVTRYFPDPEVVHMAGEIDPQRDREIISTELLLADLQTLGKQQPPKGSQTREALARFAVIEKLKAGLDQGQPASEVISDADERLLVRDLQLLSFKPVLQVANVSESQFSNIEFTGSDVLPICAKTEVELMTLNSDEQQEYLGSLGLTSSGLDRLAKKAYEQLGLISFLTAGIKEVRAWTISAGTLAPQAAGVIHTDFEKKFIKADVIDFREFIASPGWASAREQGKVRQEGRAYVMTDGDVVEFKIGA